ncbi:MAG: hypothetical protein G01um101416_873 [Microgenomates group bacterium Gr01-1014_16]|nr:MAG: hypothetical protein G01um101416_873 [Microgenomates group bacterium Gr01-1014_16]
MISPWPLFKESISLFLKNIKYLLKFWLVSVLINYPPIILVAVIAMISLAPIYSRTLSSSPTSLTWLIYVAVPIGLGWIILALWLGAAGLVQAYSVTTSTILPIKGLLSQGWKIVGKVLVTGLLTGLAVAGGFLLLIIPGFIFSYWFAFTNQIVVIENLSGTAALSRSKQLVKGRFWKTVWYLLFPTAIIIAYFFVTSAVTAAIPKPSKAIFEAVFSLITLPFGIVSLIYSFLVYREFAK